MFHLGDDYSIANVNKELSFWHFFVNDSLRNLFKEYSYELSNSVNNSDVNSDNWNWKSCCYELVNDLLVVHKDECLILTWLKWIWLCCLLKNRIKLPIVDIICLSKRDLNIVKLRDSFSITQNWLYLNCLRLSILINS